MSVQTRGMALVSAQASDSALVTASVLPLGSSVSTRVWERALLLTLAWAPVPAVASVLAARRASVEASRLATTPGWRLASQLVQARGSFAVTQQGKIPVRTSRIQVGAKLELARALASVLAQASALPPATGCRVYRNSIVPLVQCDRPTHKASRSLCGTVARWSRAELDPERLSCNS